MELKMIDQLEVFDGEEFEYKINDNLYFNVVSLPKERIDAAFFIKNEETCYPVYEDNFTDINSNNLSEYYLPSLDDESDLLDLDKTIIEMISDILINEHGWPDSEIRTETWEF